MRISRILIILLSFTTLVVGCSTSSDEKQSVLCRSIQLSMGDVSTRDPGNTREFEDHTSIGTPEFAWEFQATSLPDNPRSLAIFFHMIGILNEDRGSMTVEFVDGLLGNVIRVDQVPRDTKLVEVIDDNMFIVTESNELHRVDLGTGEVLWSLEFVDSIAFRPVVLGDVLYIASGTSNREQGHVFAINLETGKEVWGSPIPSLDGKVYPIMSPNLLVTNGAVIVNGFGFLYAFDRVTGELCWDTDASKYGLAMPYNIPVSNGEIVLFESDGRLLGLDKFDGDINWSVDGVRQATDIALSGERAIVVDENNRLKAVDSSNGEELWVQSDADYSWSRMLVSRDVVYATTADGMLRAHNLDDGELIWEIEVGEVNTQMHATEDRLYVLADGVLICIMD